MERRLSQIPERLLAELWRARAARHRTLVTQGGQRLRVLYPGRPGAGAGPDFRDAILKVAGVGVIRGDVEIHRRERDWREHHHHLDPNYDGVVLHATLETGGAAETLLSSGRRSPVLSLEPLLDEEACEGPGTDPWSLLAHYGYRRPRTAGEMARLLDRAGDERFLWKARALGQRLRRDGPCQALYGAMMEALGYSRNRQAFRELARRVPYRRLRALAMSQARGEYRLLISHVLLEACEGLEWDSFRVRPSNHPRRRVLGAARLLARHLEEGLEEALAARVRTGSWRTLLEGLMVRDEDGDALIGPGRGGDMAVNVVLPFLHARGHEGRDPSLRDTSFQVYREAPRLQENGLTHEMRRLLLPPERANPAGNARRQQGLLHLYRLFTQACSGPQERKQRPLW